MKNKLTKEDLIQIKELANRLKNQDPDGNKWGTQPPLWFLLQDVEEIFDPINDGHFLMYYDSHDDICYRGDTVQEIYDDVIDGLEGDKIPEDLWDTIEDEAQGMVNKFVTKYTFHTYEAAEEHLEANNYHYSPKARIYVQHAWRNPEAELVHKLILSFSDL